jgi:hypothetical protein
MMLKIGIFSIYHSKKQDDIQWQPISILHGSADCRASSFPALKQKDASLALFFTIQCKFE